MGLKLRIASAKLLAAAFALAMLATGPTYAFNPVATDPCTVSGASLSVTTAGTNIVSTDTNATISGVIGGTGATFEPDTLPVQLVVNNQAINNSSADGIAIDDSSASGLFGSVCYLGAATAAIAAGGDGLDIITAGNGAISLTVAHAITAGDTGIYVDRTGAGDITINTSGNIDAGEDGIFVTHRGPSGNITVNTVAGSKITATGSGSGPFGLGTAIYVERLNAGSADHVSINNAADIDAGLGILADICACGADATLDVTTSGNIKADFGLFIGTDGDANVAITGGTIDSDFLGIIQADNVKVVVASGATLTAQSYGLAIDALTSGSVTVAGKIDATGTVAIAFLGSDNTLTLEPGYSIDGDVLGGPSHNVLRLGGGTGSDTFDLDRLGTQYLFFNDPIKVGASTWTLEDAGGNFMGVVDAYEGKLKVNSSIPTLDVFLHETAAIGGTGTFNGLAGDGGILAPGNSIGTLTVATANLVGMTYQVETNAAAASDKLIVTGTATIDPTSTILALPEAGAYAKTTTYTIVTAGTLTAGSAFGSASSASVLFEATTTRDTNNITLTLTRNVAGVTGITPNQKATGAGLDSFTGPAPYFDKLMQLPAAQIPAALSALSGDGYASLITALITDQRYLRDAAFARLATARFTPTPVVATGYAADAAALVPPGTKVWGRAYGGLSALLGDGNGPGVNHGAGGIVAGADAEFGNTRLGLLAAAGISGFAIPDRSMTATSGDFSLGGYGDTSWDDFYLSFGATLTGHAIASTRTAAFAGANDVFSAQYAALTSQAFGELGYRVDLGATELTPFAALALVNNLSAGYTETGSGAGKLTVSPSSTSAAITTLGVRIEHQFVLGDDTLVTVSGSAAWRHVFGGMGATTNTFQGGAPFTVVGAPSPADSILLTAGADFNVSEDLSLGLAYSGAIGNGGSHALTGTLTGHF